MCTVYNFHAYTLRFRCLPCPWRARAWRARRLKKGRHWRRRRTLISYLKAVSTCSTEEGYGTPEYGVIPHKLAHCKNLQARAPFGMEAEVAELPDEELVIAPEDLPKVCAPFFGLTLERPARVREVS